MDTIISSKHDASKKAVGYLYQFSIALLKLLNAEDAQSQLCIEKFDDVSFHNDGKANDLIQVKHHINKEGDLSDYSVDLWKSILSWCDTIEQLGESFVSTNYSIITTNNVASDSATSLLTIRNRDSTKALKLLEHVSNISKNRSNTKSYKKFNSLTPLQRKNLVDRIYIFDNQITLDETQNKIKKHIRYSSRKIYEDAIFERIEGWWYRQCVKCLLSDTPIFVRQEQVRNKICDISDEYGVDNLPIDVDYNIDPPESDTIQFSMQRPVFIEQLKLVCISDARIKRAVREYYRAYEQRSKWIREKLVYINELEDYENALIDEWERYFLIMTEELERYGSSIKKENKIDLGRKLFNDIENSILCIRPKVDKPFITRGSYHDLANELKVGWHIEFKDKLAHLLGV